MTYSNRLKNLKDKAECIPEKDWGGDYIFDDDSSEYFESSYELGQHYCRDGIPLEDIPDYAFGTKKVRMAIESANQLVGDVIVSAERNGGDDGWETQISDFSGIPELQKAIDAFMDFVRYLIHPPSPTC
jgi:hypothetical protein